MQNQPYEKEWAGSILYLLKHECTTLCSTALESANPNVRDHSTGILNRALQLQKSLYEIMNRKGWYNVEAAPYEQYTRVQHSLNSLESQMHQF